VGETPQASIAPRRGRNSSRARADGKARRLRAGVRTGGVAEQVHFGIFEKLMQSMPPIPGLPAIGLALRAGQLHRSGAHALEEHPVHALRQARRLRSGNARRAGTTAAQAHRVGQGRRPVVWFEVEDFLRYFDHFRNPTGLQRVAFEVFVEAERRYGRTGAVRFCRLSVYSKQFQVVGFDAIVSAYLNPPGARAPWKSIWGPARLWSEWPRVLPVIGRHPLFFLSIFKAALADLILARRGRRGFERSVARGDIVVCLGAGWGFPGYLKHIAQAKRRYGIRFATLVHDLIPIENESFVEPWHVAKFRNWLGDAIPVADALLTISRYSRDALRKWAGETARALPPVEVMALGSGLSERMPAADEGTLSLPPRYVLFVSTIEIRKNHGLLVRVWQRLLERHGAELVPALIFAGQIGWLVDDLMTELAASGYAGGKILLMPGLSEAELGKAYGSCLFTVFPSLSEGWGLPVAESLVHGKFCVASDRTSIPEVGGDLIDYFDPSNEDDALAKIERLLLDPDYLAAREARLKAEYRPRGWADCARALVDALAEPLPADKAK
jgi:glycosyltransferase involved in cell wall biosynthesis